MIKNQISDKQIEANRMNALKSTGPRSIEGKEKSAQNALKFGFTAKKFIIPEVHNIIILLIKVITDPIKSPIIFKYAELLFKFILFS